LNGASPAAIRVVQLDQPAPRVAQHPTSMAAATVSLKGRSKALAVLACT